MNELLLSRLSDLKNPQLIKFQDDFELSDFAFIIQCSHSLAPVLLQRNPSSTLREYAELEIFETNVEEKDRETPFADAHPTAWLFPKWKRQKVVYIFGTLAPHCDILLPHDDSISRLHFVIYMSHTRVWRVRNLSRYGTWVNGDLLGLPEPGKSAIETTLNPDSANQFRVGHIAFKLYPIPHVPLLSHNDAAVSKQLLELETLSEGTRTTSATETGSVIHCPSNIQTEGYHYLRDRPVAVQGDLEVCVAMQKSSGQYYIAKMYETVEMKDRAFSQFEMMLNFLVCNQFPYTLSLLSVFRIEST
jgi:FHA domain